MTSKSKAKKPETLEQLAWNCRYYGQEIPRARQQRKFARHSLDAARANVAKCKLAVRAAGSGPEWVEATQKLQAVESYVESAIARLASEEATLAEYEKLYADADRRIGELREQEAAPELTIDDLRNAALGYVANIAARYTGAGNCTPEAIRRADRIGRKSALKLIKRKFGVEKVRDIPSEQWPEAITALCERN